MPWWPVYSLTQVTFPSLITNVGNMMDPRCDLNDTYVGATPDVIRPLVRTAAGDNANTRGTATGV